MKFNHLFVLLKGTVDIINNISFYKIIPARAPASKEIDLETVNPDSDSPKIIFKNFKLILRDP